MKTDLERGFDDLLGHDDRQQRGSSSGWQAAVEGGVRIHSDPKMARPRQTDVHARQAGHDFLVEAKGQTPKIDVADIDALRSRLERTPGDVVGCLFRLSDYSRTAIDAVENRRTRKSCYLTFRRDPTSRGSPGLLSAMVEDKRTSLGVHARVKFAKPEAPAALPAETRSRNPESQQATTTIAVVVSQPQQRHRAGSSPRPFAYPVGPSHSQRRDARCI